MDEDAALLAAVRDGSDLAFNRLIDRHQQAIRSFLRGLCAGPEDADDVAQETFLAVWRHARQFRGGGSVRGWIYGIAWRKARDAQRRWLRGRKRDAVWNEAGPGEIDGAMAADEVVALRQALASLNLDQKAAVMLCIGGGFSHSEAAEALGMPLGTVKSHVLRGQERLRKVFGEAR